MKCKWVCGLLFAVVWIGSGAYMRREAMMKIKSSTAQTRAVLSALSSCASKTHAFLLVDLLIWQDSLKTKNPTAL